MRTRVRTVGHAAVVTLSGKITIGSGDEDLEDTLLGLLAEGVRRIVLDLGNVGYVDSSGLGSIMACRRAAVLRGGDLVLLRPSGKVYDLLKLTGMIEILRIFNEEAEALAES